MGGSYLLRSLGLVSILIGCIYTSAEQTSSTATEWPRQTYKSTSVQAPYMNVTKNGKTELGYLFISPSDSIAGVSHPMIYSDDGELVWRGELGNISAYIPQTLDGEPVLTYFHGADPGLGFGYGSIGILNSSYQQIYDVTLPGDKQNFVTVFHPETFPSYIDIHESQITDQGTLLVTAVNVTQLDLRSVGGPENGWVQDGLFYEIDIKTNEILFRWSTLEHLSQIPLSNAREPLGEKGRNMSDPWEYPHLNSVAKYGDSYLISSRYTCSLFLIDKDGNVTWHIHGQTGGDFDLGIGATFCYQHDARFAHHSPEKATLHIHNNENANFPPYTTLTTGLVLDIDFKTKKVTANRTLYDSDEFVFVHSQGSYQNLTNDHVLLGHGSTPKIEEYDEHGACVMRARFGHDIGMQSYRAYRKPWVGRPKTKPDVVACPEKGKMAVYVSWNGATDVQSWKILTGSGSGNLSVAETAPRNGFETKVWVDEVSDKVIAKAVGGVGDGTMSKVVTVGDGC
ncbi:hypothetical protein ASPWEDRAFT_182037 [Aspergillus wentii DTO 134E9]|uniref:ASST-domain-containing protein n=1 Tax=Aspergillus wentii DTO 134E9 TaxID=1073089 RepID=A0A1L9RQH1_ASPWE|nr:uncharacterized protein ASPWEDRAFT_182037 [Aspergillus wentii DTO 134E9]KAI9928372.1 hypothetical protein MW887_002410 [Aspergillus wentii]OJJ37142.1 hypothetical protein ASPWEDRAFT_182037 [Aspergillus wentii DTO 134E9]